MDNYVLFILAAIVAGEVWNNFGYFNDWINNRTDPKWKGFDRLAFRNDLIVGGIVGLGVVVFQAISINTAVAISIPTINSIPAFFLAVAGLFGTVAAVDKVIVGGIGRIFVPRTTSTIPDTTPK